jgi:hypothetical protein
MGCKATADSETDTCTLANGVSVVTAFESYFAVGPYYASSSGHDFHPDGSADPELNGSAEVVVCLR